MTAAVLAQPVPMIFRCIGDKPAPPESMGSERGGSTVWAGAVWTFWSLGLMRVGAGDVKYSASRVLLGPN